MQQLMRNYTYQKYGEQDAYGQPTLGKGGTISMAISVISNQINDNVLYRDTVLRPLGFKRVGCNEMYGIYPECLSGLCETKLYHA